MPHNKLQLLHHLCSGALLGGEGGGNMGASLSTEASPGRFNVRSSQNERVRDEQSTSRSWVVVRIRAMSTAVCPLPCPGLEIAEIRSVQHERRQRYDA